MLGTFKKIAQSVVNELLVLSKPPSRIQEDVLHFFSGNYYCLYLYLYDTICIFEWLLVYYP